MKRDVKSLRNYYSKAIPKLNWYDPEGSGGPFADWRSHTEHGTYLIGRVRNGRRRRLSYLPDGAENLAQSEILGEGTRTSDLRRIAFGHHTVQTQRLLPQKGSYEDMDRAHRERGQR